MGNEAVLATTIELLKELIFLIKKTSMTPRVKERYTQILDRWVYDLKTPFIARNIPTEKRREMLKNHQKNLEVYLVNEIKRDIKEQEWFGDDETGREIEKLCDLIIKNVKRFEPSKITV
ncbi:hypothetical protein J4230_02140 [Candidatus Woesearchaeota archaeon]|nr:hypothetical protein [Candidatus Woesearchaeota archaeon]